MLLQFFKQANRKFILVIISFILLFRVGLGIILDEDLLSVLTAFAIHAIAAVGINGVLVKTQVIKRYSVLPLFFLLMITSNPIFYLLSDFDLPLLFGIFALVGLSKIYPAENVNSRLFNSAFLLTSLAYFYPRSIVFTIPFVFCFQFVFDLNQIRKVFLVFTALIIPLYLWLTIEFGMNDGQWDFVYLTKYVAISDTWPEVSTVAVLGLSMVGIIGLLGLADLQVFIQQKAIIARKFILFIGLLGIVEILLLIVFKAPQQAFLFLVLPLVVVLANYFDHIKPRVVHQVLFAFCILFTLIMPFFSNSI